MGKFDPESYRQYRPYYPEAMFAPFLRALREGSGASGWSVADIGCGTGHSSLSLFRALPKHQDLRLIGVDPDPRMLERARELFREAGEERARFREGSGESTGLDPMSVDGILVGSAFHWMDALQARDEFARILRPQGALCLFEYQFPKAPALPALNEWIRRQFNLRWKAPDQKPRGDFTEVTRVIRNDSRFVLMTEVRPPMILRLTPEELAGLLISQSRVLHYVWTLEEGGAREEFREEVRSNLRQLMEDQPADFDFRLICATFKWSSP